MTLPDQIRKLAARPQGMCSNDIKDYSTARVGNTAIKMLARGELHRVKLRHSHARWFTDEAAADALRAKVGSRVNTLFNIGKQLPNAAQWDEDAQAVETPATVYTLCPSHQPRFAEHTFPFVHGGLRCA